MSISRFAFSSQSDDDPAGFAGYHQLYSGGSDADRAAGRFEAHVTAIGYHKLAVFDRDLRGVRHSRNPVRVRRDGFDHINMQLVLGGDMAGGPLGDERPVRPGEIILFDMTRPQRTVIGHARMIAVSLPRQTLERHIRVKPDLHGTILPTSHAGLLADLMRSLVRQAPTLAEQASAGAVQAIASLVSAALGGMPHPEGRRLDEHFAGQIRLDRVCRYMERHLSDPGLAPERAAAALGMSRSTLTRCMAPAGGFNAALLAMRVGRMRSELRRGDPAETVGSISARLGFTSVSHATRSFSAAFGLPPRAWRTRHKADPGAAGGRPVTLDFLLRTLD